jgi:hypothetical protein
MVDSDAAMLNGMYVMDEANLAHGFFWPKTALADQRSVERIAMDARLPVSSLSRRGELG